METYFKTTLENWHSISTVFNTEPYPNQENFTEEMLQDIENRFPDGNTPKSVISGATTSIKNKLNAKIASVIDLNTVSLIDITAHMEGDVITGVINYKEDNIHKQRRF